MTARALRPLLPLALALLGACASHNAHRVPLQPETDLLPLVAGATSALEDAYGTALPERGVAIAVDVDDVDVTWRVIERDEPERLETQEEMRLRLQAALLERLGTAVVEADRVPESELRLNAWLLLDLGEIDEVGMQLVLVLTHRDRPRRVLAEGWSRLQWLPRPPCFGCRDHWFRNRGTDLDAVHRRGLYYGGFWGGYWGGVWFFDGHDSSVYTKVR